MALRRLVVRYERQVAAGNIAGRREDVVNRGVVILGMLEQPLL
jgi:hypothetical protein